MCFSHDSQCNCHIKGGFLMVIIISIWKYRNFVKCNSDTATELEILYEFSWFSGHINIKLQSKYHIISETVGILLLYWWFKTLCFYVHVPYLIWGPFWNDFTGSDYWCVLYSPLSKSCLLFEYQNCYLRLRVKIDCIFCFVHAFCNKDCGLIKSVWQLHLRH